MMSEKPKIPDYYDGAQVITSDAIDRLTDLAYETGWKAALTALELRVNLNEPNPVGVGRREERKRVLTVIAELRSRYTDKGRDYGA